MVLGVCLIVLCGGQVADFGMTKQLTAGAEPSTSHSPGANSTEVASTMMTSLFGTGIATLSVDQVCFVTGLLYHVAAAYMAPELCTAEYMAEYGCYIDQYSFGCARNVTSNGMTIVCVCLKDHDV